MGAAFDARPAALGVGFITAGMTAFYMFRLVNMTFFGESHVSHEAEHHMHESPPSMTVPLMILAVLSMVGGWIGWPEVAGRQRPLRAFSRSGDRASTPEAVAACSSRRRGGTWNIC